MIPFLSCRFPVKKLLFPFMILQWYTSVRLMINSENFDILHCRSYNAVLIGLIAKKIKPATKIIFDPRSQYIEENIAGGEWKKGDVNYKIWKYLEELYLLKSDIIIATSKPLYTTYLMRTNEKTKIELIPNNFYGKSIDTSATHYHQNGKYSICYTGHFNPWNIRYTICHEENRSCFK